MPELKLASLIELLYPKNDVYRTELAFRYLKLKMNDKE